MYIIGRGGFGKVWKVKLKKTNEFFALKEMSKMKIIDRRSEFSIMSEKTLLSKLNNPFIVNMYFTFQDFSNLYLVMDLLSGGDLRYHLAKKRKFSERETKFFITNMLLALEYIHSKNIIHRDIKPENLVLDLNGYLRITDFGVAKINEKDNSSETSGTPGYMAPEVILVQNHSFPSDFFALGVIGYEFMLGYRPYLGSSRKEIKELIIYKQARLEESDIPYSWSLESADFINKLLKRKPTKRLGYHGVKEIKNHDWLKDINWNLLKKKEIIAPFIPNPNKENFDKSYCERIEDIGETTIERYQEYIESELFLEVFEGYTFVNIDYLKSKNNNSNEKIKKKNRENEKTLLIESSSSRIKKNNSIFLSGQKKLLSISQENILNGSNKQRGLKNNFNKRNQKININIKQIHKTPKKQTIDIENKKEVLKRMSINDNIKTNKNYISNIHKVINKNGKTQKENNLKYDKEKLKNRALKISQKMKKVKKENEFNLNLNNNDKNSISKKYALNKSNSMLILNSLNKERIKINGNRTMNRINSKIEKRKEYKSCKSKEDFFNKKVIKNKEDKNRIFVEKKKSYQKYKIRLDIKDKLFTKDEIIHKQTYDINKNTKINLIKENISQRNEREEIKVQIKANQKNEEDILKIKKEKVNSKNSFEQNEKKIIDMKINENKDNNKKLDLKNNLQEQNSKKLETKNISIIEKINDNNEIGLKNTNFKNIENHSYSNKNEELDDEIIKIPQSKIMLWIQNSLPFNENNNKKYSTIDNNIYNINRKAKNIITNNEMIDYDKIKKVEKEVFNKEEMNKIDKNGIDKEYFEIENNKKNKNTINNKISETNKMEKNIIDNIPKIENLNESLHESDNNNKKNYKTITIDTNNKYKTKKVLRKKYYKSTNNTKIRNLPKNNSCSNIDFYKNNLITNAIKSKSPKNTFLVFNTININLGNTSKNFKRNRTPKIQVIKNINSSLKNIYLSNEFLFEPVKFSNYLNKKIIDKKDGCYTAKKNINTGKKKIKRNNLNKKSKSYSGYIKSS